MVEQINRPAWWWVIGLSIVMIVTAVDLFLDFATGIHTAHIVIESGVLIVMAAISTAMWKNRGKQLRRLGQEVRSLDNKVQCLDAEVDKWRADYEELMRGVGAAIDQQFIRWQLSSAEAEVALLLLKGLSFKEVATVRETSERTARDQARAVYKKGDLNGRSELSAFFLEDLLLPTAQNDGVNAPLESVG